MVGGGSLGNVRKSGRTIDLIAEVEEQTKSARRDPETRTDPIGEIISNRFLCQGSAFPPMTALGLTTGEARNEHMISASLPH